jgi:type I restriction enzyme M protein
LDKWGRENAESDPFNRFWRGLPPKSRGDYAFISHMIEIAKRQSGRVAVIAPHGVLFRGGSEGKIRKALIEENLLDAVIGLPEKLFSTTGIPVSILVFDRSREEGSVNADRKDVLFIDASREYVEQTAQNKLGDEHIDKIVQTYRKRKAIDKYSHLATINEIRDNDFNLNIPRYIDTFEEEEEIDIQALQVEIRQIEDELTKVRAQMDEYLRELGIDAR